jgi:translation elongation factor EF-Ts
VSQVGGKRVQKIFNKSSKTPKQISSSIFSGTSSKCVKEYVLKVKNVLHNKFEKVEKALSQAALEFETIPK